MGAHNYGVCLFRDGLLVGTLESNHNGGLVLDTFATPTIAHREFSQGHDRHEDNVTNSRGTLNNSRPGIALKDIAMQFPLSGFPHSVSTKVDVSNET